MSITMRIMQEFDAAHEKEFMELERKFQELEKQRNDFPKGKRLQPISANFPCNTLIWEYEFPSIQEAYNTLDFFNDDEEHEVLFKEQKQYFRNVKIEFYKNL